MTAARDHIYYAELPGELENLFLSGTVRPGEHRTERPQVELAGPLERQPRDEAHLVRSATTGCARPATPWPRPHARTWPPTARHADARRSDWPWCGWMRGNAVTSSFAARRPARPICGFTPRERCPLRGRVRRAAAARPDFQESGQEECALTDPASQTSGWKGPPAVTTPGPEDQLQRNLHQQHPHQHVQRAVEGF